MRGLSYEDSVANCEVGDLSSKFGPITGSTYSAEGLVDTNLPLFGSNTILGRSVTIHDADGQRWACATIKFGVPTIVAQVEINSDQKIKATIQFEQAADHPNSPTTVLVNTVHTSSGSSMNHIWRVHRRGGGNCARRGTYDPFMASDECSPGLSDDEKLSNCRVGDLSGKMGTLDVPMTNHAFGTVGLPLSGEYSVVDREMAIYRDQQHKENPDTLRGGCGLITEVTGSDHNDINSSTSAGDHLLIGVIAVGCVVVVLGIGFTVVKKRRRKDNNTTTKGVALL